ncbi:MAG: S-layer homology domain-containing protein [Clostridia bacterium]|nr:S-layer homology domain-containing protein [Clostridia bacterium]
MKQRIYTLIMLVVFCVSSMGMTSSASSFDNTYAYSESYASQLGIDADINEDMTASITRAELAAMIVRALNYTDTSVQCTAFSDCKSHKFASEIQYAYDLLITSGTGEKTFSPNDPVSVDTAAKMTVSALGYAMKADSMGGFPSGYMAVANSVGIFDGVNPSSPLTVGDAHKIITNMLIADVASFSGVKDGDVITETYSGSNLLMQRFGLSMDQGIVTTAGHFAVNPELVAKGDIEINGKCFRTDIDTEEFIGKRAQIWYDANDMRVYIIDTLEFNKETTLNLDEIDSFSGNIITAYNEEGKQKKYTLGSDYTFLLNGRAVVPDYSMLKNGEGTVKLIDNDNDGRYEFVICSKCEYFVISVIDMISGTIYDGNSSLKRISFTDDDEFSYKIYINGEKAEFDMLQKDMVCRVYMSEDKNVCRIYASDEKIEGTISELGQDSFVIDENTYMISSYLKNLGTELVPGTEYVILISDNGYAVDVANSKNSGFNYGYFMDYAQEEGISSAVKVKLLTSTGEIKVYTLATKVFLDDVKVSPASGEIKDKLTYSQSGKNFIPLYQVIRYRVSDDSITHIDTLVNASQPWTVGERKSDGDSLTRYVEKQMINYRQNTDFGVPGVPMRNAVIFQVPKALETEVGNEYEDGMFSVVGASVMVNNEKYPVDAYDYDEFYIPQTVVLYNSTSADVALSPNNTAKSGILISMNPAIDSEGTACYVARIYGDGIYTKHYITEDIYNDLASLDKLPDSGDVVRISFDAKGYINGISIDADYDSTNSSVTINYGIDSLETSATSWLTYFSGKVVANNTSYITIDADNSPTDAYVSGKIVNLPLNSPRYIIYNTKSKEAYPAKAGNVISSSGGGTAAASYVVCKSSYYHINTVYIYVN